MSKNIGATLRAARQSMKFTVKDASNYLTKKGFKASIKTIYSWECGNSEPTPDALLTLCEYYDIKDVLSAFGYTSYDSANLTEGDSCPEYSDEEKNIIEFFRDLNDSERTMFTQSMMFYSKMKDSGKTEYEYMEG